jgi:hypothetical protein
VATVDPSIYLDRQGLARDEIDPVARDSPNLPPKSSFRKSIWFLATNFASSGSVGRGAILTYEMIYLGPSQPD